MAKPPIEIGVASETKAFADGIKTGVINPLEDAEDALKDLAKEGDKAGDKLENAFEQAQVETKRSTRAIDDTADALDKAARRAREFETGMRRGTDGAVDATEEFKSEAVQNLSETVSSFRGDAEDIAQIAQDTLGGVVSNLGPIGMAAGAAGAAGIGLIIAAIDDAQEKEQEFREKVRELAEELIETGDVGEVSIGYIAEQLKELALASDPGAISLSKIRREAERLELNFKDLATAYAGGTGELEEQIAVIDELIAAEDERYRDNVNQYNQYSGIIDQTSSKLHEQRDALQRVADATAEARQQEKDWIEVGGAAMQARSEQIDALQDELDDAIGAWSDYYDAETGATDPAQYLAAMQARMDATRNFNANVQQLATEFGLTADEVQTILDQGIDFAPMLQSIMNSGMGEQYAQQVRDMLNGGQAIVESTPTVATVTVEPDTAPAEAELTDIARDRETIIGAVADTKTAAVQLGAIANQTRIATITARADLAAADSAITRWMQQRREVAVTVRAVDPEGRPVP